MVLIYAKKLPTRFIFTGRLSRAPYFVPLTTMFPTARASEGRKASERQKQPEIRPQHSVGTSLGGRSEPGHAVRMRPISGFQEPRGGVHRIAGRGSSERHLGRRRVFHGAFSTGPHMGNPFFIDWNPDHDGHGYKHGPMVRCGLSLLRFRFFK